ncbi:hypothetical protein [Streptomyces fuscichromogenes]|uniref:Uncharacterized protein n=1 Tax=Streptomyces fuscichromogenes TaxID=1324013 RepID=A0A917XL93_9ACTN|nr:hypothetical protein GCM10011578_074720 [Streptomyces fuscichromogenes]
MQRVAAEALGLGWSLPHWHAARVCALLEQGALDDAAVEAEASLTVADELEITLPNPQARAILALVEIRRGFLARTKEHLGTADTGSGALTQRYGPWVSLARACLADAERESGAAAVLAESFARHEPARLLALPPSHWPEIVRIALRGGDAALARTVSDALLDLAEQDGSRQIIGAVHAHLDGLLHHDSGALASAVTGYRNTGRPLAPAAACEDLAELMTEAGDTASAIRYFEEAGRLASDCGAGHDQERIRGRLSRLGVRTAPVRTHTVGPQGWANLTESERKLIPLVVEGLTNRAIADRLLRVRAHRQHPYEAHLHQARHQLTGRADPGGDRAADQVTRSREVRVSLQINTFRTGDRRYKEERQGKSPHGASQPRSLLSPSSRRRTIPGAGAEEPRVRIGGPDSTRPYDRSLLNVSAMSFGSLSADAVLALKPGAAHRFRP